MSELNQTPEELVEEIERTIEDANTIPMPIDPTLTHEGEAADAAATGVAIANVINALRVNGKAPVTVESLKTITVYGGEILMSDEEGAQNLREAIETANGRDASDIMYDDQEQITVKGAIDNIKEDMDTEISEDDIDEIFDEVFGGDD